MNTMFRFLLLCNLYLFSNAFGMQVNTLHMKLRKPVTTYNTIMTRMNDSSDHSISSESLDRKNFFKLASVGTVATVTALATLTPNHVTAQEPDIVGDISWTVHKGPFSEDDLKDFVKTESGLLYKDVAVGTGREPNDGDAVTINMVGYIFETGEKWTNTYMGIPTYQAVVRAGARENQKIMKGLNEGVKTMKKGGKRILVIPAYLAYNYLTIMSEANPGTPIIPGGSNLVCYVEVISFKKLD